MIRRMEPDDLDRVMRLWLEGNLDAHPFIPPAYWQEHAEEVRAQLPEAAVYLYEQDGAIQGFVGMTGDYLAGLFVDRRCRGAGIGRQLLQHIKDRYPAFTLRVYAENRRAAAFYFREGLSVQSEGVDPEIGRPELTMAWNGKASGQEEWDRLYQAAKGVQNPRELSPWIEAGQVAAALLTEAGHIYTGVCIDTACSLGMCAERNAIAHMITCGESRITKLTAITADGRVVPPCGACRELLHQLDAEAGAIEILTDYPVIQTKRLDELTPNWWGSP